MCLPRSPHCPTLLPSPDFIRFLCTPHFGGHPASGILLKGKPGEASGWVSV
uniref:Uncharacterized protein n=1 Tax=Aotus nancymaae TaxID=37293 RepID=A0A2K5DD47_AOTNA